MGEAGKAGTTVSTAPEEGDARGRLLAEVIEVVQSVLEGGEVDADADGDLIVRCEDICVVVRVASAAPVVSVHAPVLRDLGAPRDVHRTLNTLNASHPFVRALYAGGVVVFAAEVVADPLATDQLACVLGAVAHMASRYAPELQARYGGTTPSGTTVAPPAMAFGGYL